MAPCSSRPVNNIADSLSVLSNGRCYESQSIPELGKDNYTWLNCSEMVSAVAYHVPDLIPVLLLKSRLTVLVWCPVNIAFGTVHHVRTTQMPFFPRKEDGQEQGIPANEIHSPSAECHDAQGLAHWIPRPMHASSLRHWSVQASICHDLQKPDSYIMNPIKDKERDFHDSSIAVLQV